MAGDEDTGRVFPAFVLGLVVIAGAVGGVAFAQSTDQPSGETILENAHDQYRNAETLTGSAEITLSNATRTRSATVEYAAARPGSARVAVTHNNTTVTSGTNGTVAWIAAPGLGVQRAWNVENASSWNATEICEATRDRAFAANHTGALAAQSPAGNATAASDSAIECGEVAAKWANAKRAIPTNFSAANLTVTRTGTATVGGTEAYVVAVEPENRSIDANGTVWVAKNDSRVLKQRATHDANATVVRYHDQHFNVSIDESTFAPPTARSETAGTTTYDAFETLQADTDRDLQRLTADGFGFEEAVVTHTTSGVTVAQRYVNDTMNATLVSTDADRIPDGSNGTHVRIEGRNATVETVRGRTVAVWTEDTTTHAVVTDGSTNETVALAATVVAERTRAASPA